ncbi:MAG: DinB family protein [Phycisphaerales bacterium]|nr:DinB family protein [Phycisphaerales bacterium]
MTSNPLDILLAHDLWANRQIFDACAKLTPEQFHQRFEMGPGSLHDTATHILGAMRVWGDLLAGREQRPRLEGARRTPGELLALLEEISADLAASARAHPTDDLVTRVREGKTYTFPRGGVLAHVTTHGMHHRAQCLNMLRHLGVTPLPPSSVAEWMMMVEGAGR